MKRLHDNSPWFSPAKCWNDHENCTYGGVIAVPFTEAVNTVCYPIYMLQIHSWLHSLLTTEIHVNKWMEIISEDFKIFLVRSPTYVFFKTKQKKDIVIYSFLIEVGIISFSTVEMFYYTLKGSWRWKLPAGVHAYKMVNRDRRTQSTVWVLCSWKGNLLIELSHSHRCSNKTKLSNYCRLRAVSNTRERGVGTQYALP